MQRKAVRYLAMLGPGLIAGGFEAFRHTYLDGFVAFSHGNLLTGLIVFLASGLFLGQMFRLLDRMAARNAHLHDRDRVAGELHDSISQTLFYLNVKFRQLDDAMQGADQASKEHVSQIRQVLHDLRAQVRRTLVTLADPEPGTDFSARFHDALAALESTGVRVRLTAFPDPPPEPNAQVGEAILRIVREALRNAHQHGMAESVDVALSADDRRLRLTISDDGQGFNPSTALGTANGHFGLSVMRSSARRVGGRLSIDSAPGRGCRIHFESPAVK